MDPVNGTSLPCICFSLLRLSYNLPSDGCENVALLSILVNLLLVDETDVETALARVRSELTA